MNIFLSISSGIWVVDIHEMNEKEVYYGRKILSGIERFEIITFRYQVVIGAIILLIGMAFGFVVAYLYNIGKVVVYRPFV